MEKSFYELWKLGINLIKTKVFFPKARLIRFPFDIRGKKNMGKILQLVLAAE